MKLHELKNPRKKHKRRVGRGIAGKGGKTAGLGTKGQKQHGPKSIPRHLEGGETPLILRSPKHHGFRSRRIKPVALSIMNVLGKFKAGEKVTPKTLLEKGLVKKIPKQGIKLIGAVLKIPSFHFSGLLFSRKLGNLIKEQDRVK
ncbi:uL15 family ribosomal protein [Candidatus Berkelbacteria bacterium]|nr:uL15 family ribosomal protein [Candidatus Berkelbacteria bacterium]